MLRKWGLAGIAALMAAAAVLAACSAKKSPEELLRRAAEKARDIRSYTFAGSLQMEGMTPLLGGDAGGFTVPANQPFQLEIAWNGAHRADPMLTEADLDIRITGGMEIAFSLPVVMNRDKIWIQVPDVPFLPFPREAVGRFLEIDQRRLAEEQDAPLAPQDLGALKQLRPELVGVFFNHLDEKTYFSVLSKKEAVLPAQADVRDVVRMRIDKEQLRPLMETLVRQIAPEAIDLLAREEYRGMHGLDASVLEEMKRDLEEYAETELEQDLGRIERLPDPFTIIADVGMNREGHVTWLDITVDAGFLDATDRPGRFRLRAKNEFAGINAEPQFRYGEPGDALTVEELMELFAGRGTM
ncbi:MAG: hypothetical protein BAA02_10965 [Paenibacillaceae bacterium ZCTH02-B3]|nr:MAG: hypothetical protein BAA02_10965 [Paenibacillaceae bacterium ZCTH02-B3]